MEAGTSEQLWFLCEMTALLQHCAALPYNGCTHPRLSRGCIFSLDE